MSVELLVSIASVLLSLAVAYIPGLKDKYDQLDAPAKARVMAIALVVIAGGVFGLACANLLVLFGIEVACTPADAVKLLQILFAALIANQAAFQLLVKPFKA